MSFQCRRIGYWLHTLRYLRPVQVYGRVRHRLYRPAPELGPAPALRPVTGPWQEPARRSARMLSPTGFRFLNEYHAVDAAPDWNHPDREALWLYNLHYFDDLNAQGAAARRAWHRALLDRWVRENPPGQGIGWAPYPLSLRMVNWIKWALAGNALDALWLHSLAVQARFLTRRLEIHLLGNHLFENAKALVFAGLFFAGPEAQAWLKRGLGLLRREVAEQVLADGGHFERSPLYHSVILEDLLDLLNLARAYPGAWPDNGLIRAWQRVVQGMRGWLKTLCHPDGEISFFNDAALEIAPSPQALEVYARRLGLTAVPAPQPGIMHLADSGYIRLQRGQAVALLDVGPLGPDYLPGHAHADTLSFEMSLFGQRVLVNSGTSCYGDSPERLRQRATPAHNTVAVDGEDSSEVWSGFRVARRARPLGLEMEAARDTFQVRCAHDGYRRLPGRVVHRRCWTLQDRALTVRDAIQGGFREATAYFHFHPAVAVSAQDGGQRGSIRLPGGQTACFRIAQGEGWLQPSTYHPRFGVNEANRCLALRFLGSLTEVVWEWE